jgi:thioredoxin reductase
MEVWTICSGSGCALYVREDGIKYHLFYGKREKVGQFLTFNQANNIKGLSNKGKQLLNKKRNEKISKKR